MTTWANPLPHSNNDDETPNAASSSRRISGHTSESTGGGKDPIRWVTVEKTMGLMAAQFMADRLNVEGIPARAVQEGAGRALGLTVGILGEGRVMVPKEYEEQARRLLDEIAQEPIEWEEGLEPDPDEDL